MNDSSRVPPTILVIIGISGDLARRYLLPALTHIGEAGFLPEHFRIVGVSRKALLPDDVLPAEALGLASRLELRQMDLTDVGDYTALRVRLVEINDELGGGAQQLFYLSIPPGAVSVVTGFLGEAGFGHDPQVKLLLEKPFGIDRPSAQEMVEHLHRQFDESQLYRIDHYLAKEMAQNLVVFRESNALFKRTWNREFIERIEITARESLGVEGRSAFYEQTGALRDVAQSHLMQLAALALMEVPFDMADTPAARLAALRQLVPPTDMAAQVVRGQYEGYRVEVGNPDSMVETYVSLTLASRDPRWEGVPIVLTTGKALDARSTEICIHYRRTGTDEANLLILRIQPNEGVEVDLWVKEPGYERRMRKAPLDFSYSTLSLPLAGAYERVFVDAMNSDHSLFTTSEEVLAAWAVMAPVQHAWNMNQTPLVLYPPGSRAADISAAP